VLAVVCWVVGVLGTPAPPEPAAAPVPVFPVFDAAEDDPVLPVPVFPDEAEEDPLLAAEVVVVVREVLVFDAGTVGGALLVGTVSVGTPAVSVVPEPPPPHAVMPTASATPAENAAKERARPMRRDVMCLLGLERIHATPAMWAVVEILLRELVTPIAETEVLDRPRQLGERGSERQQHGHHLELFAALSVDVCAPASGFDDHLAASGGGPEAVLLIDPHRFHATSGQEARHHGLPLG
jgi:hypothetical protein